MKISVEAKALPPGSGRGNLSSRLVLLFAGIATITCQLLVAAEPKHEWLAESVVLVFTKVGDAFQPQGTGFFVSSNGLVSTADHVIYDETNNRPHQALYVQWRIGTNFAHSAASVVLRMRAERQGRDIAFLSSTAKNTPFLAVGQPTRLGEEVVLAGFPKVFDKPKGIPLLRQGIVSALDYSVDGHAIIIFDLKAVNGFSGGPVVQKATGNVIAVMKGDFSTSPDSGFSFAYPLRQSDVDAAIGRVGD